MWVTETNCALAEAARNFRNWIREPLPTSKISRWNLENANGWGGAPPDVNVSNKYVNSTQFKAGKCLKTTFADQKSRFFTSFTVYDSDRYLIPGVRHISSYTWKKIPMVRSRSRSIVETMPSTTSTPRATTSRSLCGTGVSQEVLDGKIAPETTVQ